MVKSPCIGSSNWLATGLVYRIFCCVAQTNLAQATVNLLCLCTAQIFIHVKHPKFIAVNLETIFPAKHCKSPPKNQIARSSLPLPGFQPCSDLTLSRHTLFHVHVKLNAVRRKGQNRFANSSLPSVVTCPARHRHAIHRTSGSAPILQFL